MNRPAQPQTRRAYPCRVFVRKGFETEALKQACPEGAEGTVKVLDTHRGARPDIGADARFAPLADGAPPRVCGSGQGPTVRAHDRVLKVTRSIADLEGAKQRAVAHRAEATQYRTLDCSYGA